MRRPKKETGRRTYGRASRNGDPAVRTVRRIGRTAMGHRIETGVFGADMQVELVNDGPVTIWIDSKNRE